MDIRIWGYMIQSITVNNNCLLMKGQSVGSRVITMRGAGNVSPRDLTQKARAEPTRAECRPPLTPQVHRL